MDIDLGRNGSSVQPQWASVQHLEGGTSPAAFSPPALVMGPGEQESGMKEAMDMSLRVEMPCRS